MNKVHFKGLEVQLKGNFLKLEEKAPDFTLVKEDLSEVKLSDFKQKKRLLNIFPSVDTGVCSASVKRFNTECMELKDVMVLCISKDLPFAQKRFCAHEGMKNILMLSDFRNGLSVYGLEMLDGPLKGLLARAVLILDEQGNIIYKEIIQEITTEPNYEKALEMLKN